MQEKNYWEAVNAAEMLVQTYWEEFECYPNLKRDRVEALEHLLERGCASQAVHLLAWMAHDEELDVSKVVEALSRLVSSSDQIDDSPLSNDVAELLKRPEQEDFEHSALPMLG